MGKLSRRPFPPPRGKSGDLSSSGWANLPDPNSLATFPPEILDEILEKISANREGRSTLITCALIATRWTGPSQRRLFSSVEIYDRNYERWMNGVVLSRSKARLLKHVRSLQHRRGPGRAMKYQM